MDTIRPFLALLGRLCLCAIFLSSGVHKAMDWENTASYMAAKGMPVVPVFLVGAIVFEVVGGLLVLVGFKARIGALALVIFLIPTTLIFHNFWAFEEMERQMQMIEFLKNLSILGGLLMVVSGGPGGLSLDGRWASASGGSSGIV